MVAKKKATTKRPVKKAAKKAAPKKPTHPLKVNGKEWDKGKVMDIVCDRLASTDMGLDELLTIGWEGHALPSSRQVWRWLDDDESGEIRQRYTRARELQAHHLGDQAMRVPDEAEEPLVIDGVPVTDNNGEIVKVLTSASVQRARLKLDAIKWRTSKLSPKEYGERIQTEHSGQIGLGQILSDIDGKDSGLPSDPED